MHLQRDKWHHSFPYQQAEVRREQQNIKIPDDLLDFRDSTILMKELYYAVKKLKQKNHEDRMESLMRCSSMPVNQHHISFRKFLTKHGKKAPSHSYEEKQ